MQISDASLLSLLEIEELILIHRQAVRCLDHKISQITSPTHTVLSEHGVVLLQSMRQQTALRLGALLEEKTKREKERHAKRKKRATITAPARPTDGTENGG